MLNEQQAEALLNKSNGTLKHLEQIGAPGHMIDGNFSQEMRFKTLMQPKSGEQYYECFKKNAIYWRRVRRFIYFSLILVKLTYIFC